MESLKFEAYQELRDQLQREINSTVYEKQSHEQYAKTPEEKAELKNAKNRYKASL